MELCIFVTLLLISCLTIPRYGSHGTGFGAKTAPRDSLASSTCSLHSYVSLRVSSRHQTEPYMCAASASPTRHTPFYLCLFLVYSRTVYGTHLCVLFLGYGPRSTVTNIFLSQCRYCYEYSIYTARQGITILMSVM